MSLPEAAPLIAEICALIHAARSAASRQVNSIAVLTNFEVGRRIVHHEQGGEARAEYGKAVLQTLSDALTAEFGRGWSVTNLTLMRRFYLTYRDRLPNSQTPSTKSPGDATSVPPFPLSWSQYVFLMGIDDPQERSFYEVEAVRNGWVVRELRRQFDSSPSGSSSARRRTTRWWRSPSPRERTSTPASTGWRCRAWPSNPQVDGVDGGRALSVGAHSVSLRGLLVEPGSSRLHRHPFPVRRAAHRQSQG